MKSNIVTKKPSHTKLKFADLNAGQLYNYNVDDSKGVVLCAATFPGGNRLVELSGEDIGYIWSDCVGEADDDFYFTPFNNKIELSNN